jgi:hypothetical protein
MKFLISEHSFITPEALGGKGYREFCRLAELEPLPFGYGVLHCIEEDDANKHWTLVTTDVDYVRSLVSQPILQGVEIDRFRIQRGRWPG